MTDNNTFVLFEEIKNKLETIYRELKELKEKEYGSVSLPVQSTPAQSDEQKEQELLNQHEQRTKEVINKYIGVQVRIKDEEAKSIDTVLTSSHRKSLLPWWLCLSSVLFLWSVTTSCGKVNSNTRMMP